jgi:hypothetical protein
MSGFQLILVVIVEFIIALGIFGIWRNKFASRRAFLLITALSIIVIDILIGVVVGIHHWS